MTWKPSRLALAFLVLLFSFLSVSVLSQPLGGKQDLDGIKKDFSVIDKDKNGLLDASEIRIAIPTLEEEDLSLFMESADGDRDGVLTFEEYLHAESMIDKPKGSGKK